MKNAWRVAVFDIAAPLAAICALLGIGVVLSWPRWWVATCSVLVLLIVQGVAVNVWLWRRDSVTVGTDDDAPALRFAVDPTASIDRAAAMMVPEQATAFKQNFGKATADLAQRNVTATASTLEAGVEAIGPSAAAVAVVLRATQNTPGQPPDNAVLALHITLTKHSDHWLVLDVSPINAR
jgi:hypothetical protein